MAKPVTAVFDIGKTNKKFLLFDENYSVLQKQQTNLDQIQDEDGDSSENLEQLEVWIKDKLEEVQQERSLQVQALNFSTYGASLVHVDKHGNAVPPLYNYLKDYPKDLLRELYSNYGGRKMFALQTASPPMGMLNSGLQLYWLKHKRPRKFKKLYRSLHFPQYLSFLFTGRYAADQTSIGCHTGLWEYKRKDYHSWVSKEGLSDLLPSVYPASTTFDTVDQELGFKAGIGIHDSSAALVPYQFALDEPFMLVSTGTWSITLNPYNKEPLTFEELQKDCLCYLDIQGDQVKASRFFLGKEYMHQVKEISEHFGVEYQEGAVDLDTNIIKRLISSDSLPKLELSVAHNSGPFPQDKPGNWSISKFATYQEAYHQLMLDLVYIQVKSIKLAQGRQEIKKIIVTGGFSQNDFYINLLASFLPNKSIYTASLPHASALGAAMVVNTDDREEEEKSLNSLLGLQQHFPKKGLKMEGYSWR